MRITEKQFELLEKKVSRVDLDLEYIPSGEDLKTYVEKDLNKYAAYLLWIFMQNPKPLDEEERASLKEIRKLINHAFVIEFDDKS